jgi:F-type H+-transporting ATPase subunit b
MLSRVALKSGVFASVFKQATHGKILAIPVRCTSTGLKQHAENWEKANQIYFGPDRDTKNFPIEAQPAEVPPTRMGILPKSWFDAFYQKTGVTGPYVFGTTLGAYLISKEILIVEHIFVEFFAFWAAVAILCKKLGPGLSQYFNSQKELFERKYWVEPIQAAKASSEAILKDGELALWQMEGEKYLFEAKRENVDLQLEAVYRQRLAEVHTEVKKRLDYQIDIASAKRDFEQKHMVNWITSNVVKAITPQQEKESINKCIQDIKALAAKQQAATV